jgi:hypothetical protein
MTGIIKAYWPSRERILALEQKVQAVSKIILSFTAFILLPDQLVNSKLMEHKIKRI